MIAAIIAQQIVGQKMFAGARRSCQIEVMLDDVIPCDQDGPKIALLARGSVQFNHAGEDDQHLSRLGVGCTGDAFAVQQRAADRGSARRFPILVHKPTPKVQVAAVPGEPVEPNHRLQDRRGRHSAVGPGVKVALARTKILQQTVRHSDCSCQCSPVARMVMVAE